MKIFNFKKKKIEVTNKRSSRDHMKTQKSVIFAKDNLKMNI